MSEITRFPEEEYRFAIREVLIHEYYEKIDGEVYWNWKFEHENEFKRIPVPFPEIPYVKFKMTNEDIS